MQPLLIKMISKHAVVLARRWLQPCLWFYNSHPSTPYITTSLSLPFSSLSASLTCCGFYGHHLTTDIFCLPYIQFLNNFVNSNSTIRSVRQLYVSCDLCKATREFPDENEINTSKQGIIDRQQFIQSASLEKLLEVVPEIDSSFEACLVVQRLNYLKKQSSSDSFEVEVLLQDPRLTRTLHILDKNVTKINSNNLLKSVQAFLDLTTNDNSVIQSLLNQVLWVMPRIPIALLIQVIQMFTNHQETMLRKSVLKQAQDVLRKRWVELKNPRDIISVMYMLNHDTGKKALMQNLEDRALDFIEMASSKELYRIIYLLSRQGHRNTPLIRAILYHLNKTTLSSLSAVQLNNLLFACCVLNVYDAPLLEKVGTELKNKQAELTQKLIASAITSFSRLRWSQASTLQFLIELLDGDCVGPGSVTLASSGLDATDQVSVIYSLANLNLCNERCRELIFRLAQAPDLKKFQQSSPLLWLDVVWSLAIINKLDASFAASVLTPDFWRKIPLLDGFQSILNFTKLSSINTAAMYEVAGYTGPFLAESISKEEAKVLLQGDRKTAKKVIAALLNMAPLDSYTRIDTCSQGGYLIDAEFYVNSQGEPQPLSRLSQDSSLHRIALKVLDFSDITMPMSDLTGLHAMAARHLICQGYIVIHVLDGEVAQKNKVVELVQFLQQKIKDALKNNTKIIT